MDSKQGDDGWMAGERQKGVKNKVTGGNKTYKTNVSLMNIMGYQGKRGREEGRKRMMMKGTI